MKKLLLVGILSLIFSCAKTSYKTIDFGAFSMTVPENWGKLERKRIDSFVGGLITDTADTLTFDLGWYSGDISDDFPMVYDTASIVELTKKERELLPKTKHLIVEDYFETANIDFKEYMKYQYEYDTIECFRAKIITPTNKGYGATGIYIDSLSRSGSNKVSFNFYGFYLTDKTQAEFLKALKTLQFKKYCSQQ